MPQYLIKQRRGWYAVLEIPKALRKQIGKARFKETLKTDSQTLAEVRALPLIAQWKAEIEAARTGNMVTPSRIEELLQWREDYQRSRGEERQTLDWVIDDMVENSPRRSRGDAELVEQIVRGSSFPLDRYVDDWIGSLHDQPKTKDMKRQAVNEFAASFAFSHQVSRQSVKEWAHNLLHNAEKRQAPKTVGKKLSFLGRYWKFLQSAGHLKGDDEPFKAVIDSPKRERTKAASQRGWVALTDQEVVAALDAAQEDHQLSAVIWLAMWTGCRIEEVCSLKVSDVSDDRLRIKDAKTEAGNREVPIHSDLTSAIKSLKDSSYDGYIISGLNYNKYEDRSNAVGKRFRKIIRSISKDERKVFHSIRKTVVTQLENAGVPTGFIADIAGHEKVSFTTHHYSAGAYFQKKKGAIEHLAYPLNGPYDFGNKKDNQSLRSLRRRRTQS